MGYKFDAHGFLVIPDPGEAKLKRQVAHALEQPIVIAKHAFCPNGHDVIWENAQFNGFAGLRLKVRRANGEEGELIMSPIFGDKAHVTLGIKPQEGEKLDVFCPICNAEISVLMRCENCENGEIRFLSMEPKYDMRNGIAFCDVMSCSSAYLLDAGKLITMAALAANP